MPDTNTVFLAILNAIPVGTVWPDDGYDVLIELDGVKYPIVRDDVPRAIGGRECWVWTQRQGKPWQAAVEETVRRFEEAAYYANGL